jgi:hypothetical protein
MKKISVTKASGLSAPFERQKLINSLKRSGADDETTRTVLVEVESRLYEGITTKEIYKIAFDLLRKTTKDIAARYKLKRAIMELGPSGFPFEIYVSEILKYRGYQVKVGQMVNGFCVKHEIDVIADKENEKFMIECKYHNAAGIFCEIKIPLYIHARFLDIKNHWEKSGGKGIKFDQPWVVTNTKFSDDSIKYGICSGMFLLGWNYPATGSLRELIEDSKLYPITCLSSLTLTEKQLLLKNKIVLSKEISSKPELLSLAKVSSKRIFSVVKEINTLCGDLNS